MALLIAMLNVRHDKQQGYNCALAFPQRHTLTGRAADPTFAAASLLRCVT